MRLLAVGALVLAGSYGIFSAFGLSQSGVSTSGPIGSSSVAINVAATAAYAVLCLGVAAYFLFQI